jgi:hypothetical protein
MSQPTNTLATLRREIARKLQMPFFRRYSAGFLTADSGDTTSFIDSDLTQVEDFWKRAWVYRIASQEVSQIVKFFQRTNECKLEAPITSMTGSSTYEIHSLWTALEIHKAINDSIHDVERVFLDTLTSNSDFVIQEDIRHYDLTTLSRDPYLINKVWIEQPTTVARGTVVSATSTTLVVESSGILSGVDTNWMVSIYAGTGKGQVRAVASVASATITTTAWTTTPDSTSKYALWNANKETFDWYPYNKVRFDAKEFPSQLYLAVRPVSFYGMRIRLEYSTLPSELSAEADTTTVPESYLIPAAIAKLHSDVVGDSRADRELHFGEAKRYMEMAEQYLIRNTPHRPDAMVFLAADGIGYQTDHADPLNWEN